MGTPEQAVRVKMQMNGVPASDIAAFFGESAPSGGAAPPPPRGLPPPPRPQVSSNNGPPPPPPPPSAINNARPPPPRPPVAANIPPPKSGGSVVSDGPSDPPDSDPDDPPPDDSDPDAPPSDSEDSMPPPPPRGEKPETNNTSTRRMSATDYVQKLGLRLSMPGNDDRRLSSIKSDNPVIAQAQNLRQSLTTPVKPSGMDDMLPPDDSPPPPSDDDSLPSSPPRSTNSRVSIGPPPPDDDDDSMPPPSENPDDATMPPPSENPDDDMPPDDDSMPPPEDDDSMPPPDDDVPGTLPNNLAALSIAGLSIPKRPSLMINDNEKLQAAKASVYGNITNKTGSLLKPGSESPTRVSIAAVPIQRNSTTTKPQDTFQAQAFKDGFIQIHGKFEDDASEVMYMKANDNKIVVRVSTGDEMEFTLTDESFVTYDYSNKQMTLEHAGSLIIFRYDSLKELKNIISSLPSFVFGNDDATNYSSELSAGSSPDGDEKKNKKLDYRRGYSNPPKDAPPPGTFNDDEFQPPPPDSYNRFIKGYKRSELIEEHIKKPKFSVLRMKLITRWLNEMKIWSSQIDINTLHHEMCNGLFLAALMKKIEPTCKFVNLNQKPRTQKAAIDNLEQALGFIWRCKSMNTSRIPSSVDIYNGNIMKMTILLQEIFEVYIVKPLYKEAIAVLSWYHAILSQYQMPLPDAIFDNYDLADVWPSFQSGVGLFCVIYHLHGPITLGEGATMIKIDPMRIVQNPFEISEYRENLLYVLKLLKALDVQVLWDVDDWITVPDTEFLMLQLNYIYEKFKSKQCSLPPAQGSSAGVTSGPNGKPLVVGLSFADSHPVSSANDLSHTLHKKQVLLGDGSSALKLLPIDTGGKTGRFLTKNGGNGDSVPMPLGIVSTNITVERRQIDVKFLRETVKDRSGWNQSSSLESTKRDDREKLVLNILRNKAPPATFVPDSPKDNKYEGVSESKHGTDTNNEEAMRYQLHQAIEKLEANFLETTNALNDKEDELAERYIELETSADTMNNDDYIYCFDELEIERQQLEQERMRNQDHFNMRMASIKQQHIEALVRIEASKANNASTTEKSSKKVKINPTVTTAAPSTPPKPFVVLPTKLSESKNVYLNKLYSESEKALEKSWNSPRIKDKSATTSLAPATKSYQASTKEPIVISENTNPAIVFKAFKSRLHANTTKWLLQRHKVGTAKMSDFLTTQIMKKSSGKNAYEMPLIPIPEKAGADSLAELANAIREQELKFMLYEDNRRKLVIEHELYIRASTMRDNEYSQDVAVSESDNDNDTGTQITKAAALPDNTTNVSSNVSVVSKVAPPKPTAAEIDASYKFLSCLRVMKIGDRSKKEYVWGINKDYTDGSKILYTFFWKDSVRDTTASPDGFVILSDVKDITLDATVDPTLIIITVGDNTKSLKNSAGRTHVSFNCSTGADANRYYMSLQCLRYTGHY